MRLSVTLDVALQGLADVPRVRTHSNLLSAPPLYSVLMSASLGSLALHFRLILFTRSVLEYLLNEEQCYA